MVGGFKNINLKIKEKARKIKLVLTDSDGVLTDTGVYYSERGEEMKRFSIRDGMGVERLRNLAGVETGIVTGELSGSVKKRAEKLLIHEVHQGVKDKKAVLNEIVKRKKIKLENVAFIGDDTNDLDVLTMAGLSACPSDAVIQIKQIVDYITDSKGGYGAFRDFAELIIASIEESK
ncbi:MAG: HAD-IIIA family hydrolase [Chlorobi bacterium]|nr:HAD-IIIA family hydrolase [Chlorobiota bacterium]MCI0715054.1 HAD-IIIA family hydrolase [Chlorobiota bacterium]